MNERQRRFADNYLKYGQTVRAALEAGYSEHYAKGNATRLLHKPEIQEYIKQKNEQIQSRKIADMEEINEFWTSVMRNEEIDIKDRIKASELRAKVQGAFVERRETVQTGELTGVLMLPEIKEG